MQQNSESVCLKWTSKNLMSREVGTLRHVLIVALICCLSLSKHLKGRLIMGTCPWVSRSVTTLLTHGQRQPYSGPTCTREDAARGRGFPSYHQTFKKISVPLSSQISSQISSGRVVRLKACLSIPVPPKYNALSQTTAGPTKFNGLEEKQHMAVCRISFLCFVNKFPPESALTGPGTCQNAHSLSPPRFSICFQNRPPTCLSEHCLLLMLVLSSTYFSEFQIQHHFSPQFLCVE